MADPHNHTHQQRRHTPRRLSVLAIGALLATLLTIAAAPAGAAEIKTGDDNKAEPSATATFTACLGPALDDAGFEDLEGLGDDTTNAINCLAYYGITKGRNGGTEFDPDSNVTRGQMALFLYRAAKAAGIDLMGGDMDAMYGDIDELSQERQAAIKALARNNILTGRNSMSFYPLEDITRAEMAIALVNLTQHTAPGSFVQAGTDKGKLAVGGAAIDSSALDWFTDARRTVPVSVDTHISYAYELGITTGYPNGTNSSTEFRPNNPVPRRNMASFITRALAHSNLRPEGLTVQSDNGQLTASIRDADYKPVRNELIDAFYVDATRMDRAFNNDGECRSIVKTVDNSDTKCEIHITDSATNADGNTSLNGLNPEQIVGQGVTVWVWTGDAGDKVDDDTDLVELHQGPVVSPSMAAKITVSPGQTGTPMARFGTAVQFTAQLQYTDSGLDKNTSVGTDGMSGAEYSLVTTVFMGVIGTEAANLAVADTNGLVTAQDSDSAALGTVSISAPEILKTGADGKITFSLSTDDPNPSATSRTDARTVVYVLTPLTNAPGAVSETIATPVRASGYVVFGEAPSAVTTVKVESIGSYAELSTSASNPASHGVTVTVTDQYGRPLRNRPVTLSSTSDASAMVGLTRSTGPDGSVRIYYNHSGTDAIKETVTATWDAGPAVGDGDEPPDVTGMASVYWALRSTDAEETTGQSIIAANLADDEIIVNTTTPTLVRYDDNDIFHVTVPGDGASYTDMEGFEALLATVVDPANLALVSGESDLTGKRNATLEWDAYVHDDEDARTLFTFVLTIAP